MRSTRTIARRYLPGVEVIDGFPIPAGGAGEDGGSEGGTDDGTDDGGESDGTDDDASGTDGDGDGPSSTDDDGDGEGGAGSKAAVLADLAKERQRRKAAEKRARDLETANEGETERREREAREQAQTPAIRALRSTAVETAARDAGFLYPGDAFALLTADERESIEVDLDSEEPGIDRDAASKVVKALAKRRPALIRAKGDDGGSGAGGSDHQAGGGSNGSNSSSDPNATLRELFRKRTTRV